ncbi:MAG: PAS domain S-box protein [Calditrichaeota bacterium]|nr:PAS domain S-box protein [Calditrichota bacterium]
MIAKRDVLIAVDDIEFQKEISVYLSKNNYDVISANDVNSTIENAKKHKPSVALIEISQTERKDIIPMIKEVSSQTECIIIAEHAFEISAIEATNMGVFNLILKPVDLNQLLISVLRACEKHDSEEKLRFLSQIAQQVDDSVIACDLDYKIIWVNQAFQSLYGYTLNEVAFEYPGFLNAEPNADKIEEMILSTIISGKTWKGELKNRKKDGTEFPIDLSITPLKDDHGQIVGYGSFQRDITKRVGTAEALMESERKYHELVDLLPQTVYEIDLDGSVTFLNQFGIEASGYSRVDLEKGISAFHIIAEKDHSKLSRNISSAREGAAYIPSEYEIIRKDGSTFTALIYANCIMRDNVSIGLRGILIDTSKLRELERALQHSTQMSNDILQTIPSGLFTYQFEPPDELFLLSGNPEAVKLTGIDLEKSIGKEFNEIWPNAIEQGITEAYLEVARTGVANNANDVFYEDDRFQGVFRIRVFRIPNNRIAVAFEDESKRQIAESELKRSVSKFRSYIDNAPDGIFVTDGNGIHTEVNEGACNLTGYSNQELLKMSLQDLITTQFNNDIIHDFKNLSSCETLQKEYPFILKDGSDGFMMLDTVKLEDDKYLTFCKDITVRKLTEQALLKSKERLLQTQKTARMGFWEWNLKADEIFISNQVYALYGIDKKDTRSNHEILCAIVHPDDRDNVHKELKRVIKGQDEYDNDLRILRPDGKIVWAHAQAKLVLDEKGKPESLLGSIIDITRRKETEAAFSESERRYRKLVENIPVKLSHYDVKKKKYAYWNTDELWTGMSIDEWNSLSPEKHLSYIHPEDVPLVRDAIREWEKTGQKETLKFEYRIRSKENEYSWLESWIYNEFDENKNHISTIQLYWDITERKEVEQQQKKLAARFQEAQKKESLSILAGGIAHDFNNILVGILGNANFALSDISPTSPLRESIIEIEKSAQRAADLTRQMLAYSGKGHFVIEDFSLSKLIEEMIRLVKASISKKAEIELNLDKKLPAINGDITQIRQLVMNLIINASEAIGDETGRIKLKTCVEKFTKNQLRNIHFGEELEPGKYIYMSVEDTGCGMDKNTLNKIFDPFFTTKFTGRGLGLAATLGIVEGHKGAINVISELGKGTKFEIYLPKSISKQVEKKEAIHPVLNDDVSGTILVVDDEKLIVNLVSKTLQRSGYKVITAKDGFEAVEKYKSKHKEIDLVIMDLTMPNLNGEEAFEQIKTIDPDSVVIISSGFGESEAEKRFFGRGLSGFIQKPFTPTVLINTVRKILSES